MAFNSIREKGLIQTAILLFDQNGHPVVPTCASPCLARTAAVKDGRQATA